MLIFYKNVAPKIVILSILGGGILVWIFARSSYHVGASGLIYSLAAFLIANGFFRKNFKSIVIAVAIVIFYGGLFWGIFPTKVRISWEGHLFGAIAGIILAYIFKNEELDADSNE